MRNKSDFAYKTFISRKTDFSVWFKIEVIENWPYSAINDESMIYAVNIFEMRNNHRAILEVRFNKSTNEQRRPVIYMAFGGGHFQTA